MRILLCQLDGDLPNIALMRISTHHRLIGDEVELCHGAAFENLYRPEPDLVYASAIFRKTLPLAERALRRYPRLILGGTGVDPARRGEAVPLSQAVQARVSAVENYGIRVGESAVDLDYALYPWYAPSIGFSQRGCRLKCAFCCVHVKEPEMRAVQAVGRIWRGPGHPKHLHLLDNDFFGQPNWQSVVEDIQRGDFKVSFNQGINARFLTDEAAAAIASVDYRDASMKVKRIYTAWDNVTDRERLFSGLGRLVKYGVKPDHIMVYMLCGFWPWDQTPEDWNLRRQELRDFGARPYPMPFVRTAELVGFQRFVIGAYDKRFSWKEFVEAGYRPENLGKGTEEMPLFREDV